MTKLVYPDPEDLCAVARDLVATENDDAGLSIVYHAWGQDDAGDTWQWFEQYIYTETEGWIPPEWWGMERVA